MADLRTVGHHDDLMGAVDHGPVAMRLHGVVRGAPGPDLDPVHSHENNVEVERGQAGFSQRARQLVGVAAYRPPGDDEGQVGPHGQLRGNVEGVGDDGEALAIGQRPGHLGGRGPPRQPDGHPLDHVGSRFSCDTALFFGMADAFVAQGQLVGDGVDHGAAVGAAQQPLLFQHGQVAPDRGGGDTEVLGQFGHAHGPAVGQPSEDGREALFSPHRSKRSAPRPTGLARRPRDRSGVPM